MKYKAIIFDLDNTLLDYTQSELACLRRTVHEHELFRDDEAGWEHFLRTYLSNNFNYWIDFVNNRGRSRSIHEVLFYSFRDTLQLGRSVHESLSATYWNYFCHTCYFEEGAEQLLQSVQDDYKLGIVSNGLGEAQRKRLATGGIDRCFQSIVVSDEVGLRKPRKEIFELALKELGLEREEALFIGDSLTDDYVGAQNAGIDFCFYNRDQHQAASTRHKTPKYTVQRLGELTAMLGGAGAAG